MKLETKFSPSLALEIDEAEGTFSGYASRFGEVDNAGDIVAPGAFRQSLAAKRPVLLADHDPTRVVGVIDSLVEDHVGLKMTARLNLDTQDGRETHSLVKMGAKTGLSIGYRAGRTSRKGDVRVIEQIDLWEVSIVAMPSLGSARVESVKSAATDQENIPETTTDSERAADEGSTSTENEADPAPENHSAGDPAITETTMTPEQIAAAIAAAVAPVQAELTETKSALADLETKAARGPALSTATVEADETKAAFVQLLRTPEKAHEVKNIVSDTTSGGRYLIPHTVAAQILEIAHDETALVNATGRVSVSAPSYSEPVDGAEAEAIWVGESDDRTATNGGTIGEIRPTFGEVSAVVPVSRHLLNDAAFDIAGHVVRKIARAFARKENAAILAGSGVNGPKGLLTGATAIDVANVTGAAATDTDVELLAVLINLRKGVKAAYRKAWYMSSETEGRLIGLKNGTTPVYMPSIAAGVPSTLFGLPVILDESLAGIDKAASAGVAGYNDAELILLGDLERAYLSADVQGFSLQLNPYKVSGFVLFEAFKRVGGITRDRNAVKGAAIGGTVLAAL